MKKKSRRQPAPAAPARAASGSSKKGPPNRQEYDGYATDNSDLDLTPVTEEDLKWFSHVTNSTPEEITILFVDALERVDQCYKFQDFLQCQCGFIKPDSNPEDAFLHLVRMEERNDLFNKLDEKTIMDYLFDRIMELQTNDMLRYPSERPSDTSFFMERNQSIRKKFETMSIEAKDSQHPDPIFELLRQARKGKVLHRNPEIELDKIKKSHPVFYQESFILYKLRSKVWYSENTVNVAGLSNGHTDARLKEIYSVCGQVGKIERKRSVGLSGVVHVTFKNSEAAKVAPFVMGPHSLVVERIPESRGSRSPLEGALESAMEEGENVGSMHGRALAKYKELRSEYMEYAKKQKHASSGSVGVSVLDGKHKRRSRSQSPGVSVPVPDGLPVKRCGRSRAVQRHNQPLN